MTSSAVKAVKTCSACRVEKPFVDFHRNFYSADGRQWNCKACVSKYYRENPESWWSSNYRRRALALGVEPKDFYVTRQELVSRDGEGCALCGVEGVPLELDHVIGIRFGGSHSPWNCRLLCSPCHRGRRPEEAATRRQIERGGE